MADYIPVLFFALMAAIIPIGGLAALALFRPSKPDAVKLSPYECGVEPTSEAWDHRFSVRYYLIAVLFVVFDVETIFASWAVMYQKLLLFGLHPDAGLPRYLARRIHLCLEAERSHGPDRNSLPDNLITTKVDELIGRARKSSLWPMQLALLAVETMAVVDSRHDMACFGAEVFRGSPRQSDLMLVGTVTEKMAPIIKRPAPPGARPLKPGHRNGLLRDLRRALPHLRRHGVDRIVPVDVSLRSRLPPASGGPP